jgi:uncharacterized protein (DUF1684 family)
MSDISYVNQIKQIREDNDKFFKESDDSPLSQEQKQSFQGLDNFPIDEKYNLLLKLEKFEEPEEITILASKGDERQYMRWGVFEFELNGKINRLTVFKPLLTDIDYLFVPFKDTTTGVESYGGGRYLHIEHLIDEKYRLDFNLAYNPYCAFNHNYSCTLIPPENILDIPIHAGQKKFHD